MALIEVEQLRKEYRVLERKPGLVGSLKSLVSRRYNKVTAVDGISFSIEPGEFVGFIGPNGAGKTTTIKMLIGLLPPTGGRICIAGRDPWRQRIENSRNMGVIFGQRTQLWWDLPVIDSYEVLRHIYDIPKERYQANLARFNELLGLPEFINTPVRNLSLGQRMRADFAAALLHDPQFIYLDEPTIGLDLIAKVAQISPESSP